MVRGPIFLSSAQASEVSVLVVLGPNLVSLNFSALEKINGLGLFPGNNRSVRIHPEIILL